MLRNLGHTSLYFILYGLLPAENDGSRIRRWFYPVILSGFHSPPMRIIKCPLRYFAAKVGQRFDLSKKSCIFVHCYLILIYDKSRNC